MAENVKYNLKDGLLEADERLTGSPSLLGASQLTFPTYNNAMRTNMFTSHIRQTLTLLKPEFAKVFTNTENIVGKHSSGYLKAEHDTTVFRKITKFEDISDQTFISYYFVFDEKKKKYDVWVRDEIENLTEMFGFKYNNEVFDSIEEGDFIPKGTVLRKSTSYDEFMNYGYGKNVPIMYTMEPYTSEDACVAAESLAEEMTSIEPDTVSIGINQNDFLLNLYGDMNHYKPLPELGEYAHGELCVKRTLFNDQLLTDFKDSSLNHILDSDTCYYKSGKVVDIVVYCNDPEIEENSFNSQILKYYRSQQKFYEEIKETCEYIKASGYKYSRNINYWLKRAKDFLNEETRWRDKDSMFSNLTVEITVFEESPLQIGQKLSGRYGNKSVISKILPDDEMPYYIDENGKKVTIKLLFNALAIINRTTAFPIYEISINFICNKVRCQMEKMRTLKQKEALLFGIIEDFNEEQARRMKKTYDGLTTEEKKEYIQATIDEGIFIHQNPMWETKPIFYRLMDIYNKYDFLKPYDMYIKKWGREIKMLNPVYAGEMYIIE